MSERPPASVVSVCNVLSFLVLASGGYNVTVHQYNFLIDLYLFFIYSDVLCLHLQLEESCWREPDRLVRVDLRKHIELD